MNRGRDVRYVEDPDGKGGIEIHGTPWIYHKYNKRQLSAKMVKDLAGQPLDTTTPDNAITIGFTGGLILKDGLLSYDNAATQPLSYLVYAELDENGNPVGEQHILNGQHRIAAVVMKYEKDFQHIQAQSLLIHEEEKVKGENHPDVEAMRAALMPAMKLYVERTSWIVRVVDMGTTLTFILC